MINILSGVTDLENISLGVAVSVIALLAITYVLLFFVWHKYYEKCINHGLEDLSLKRDIMVEYKKFLKPIPLKKIENDTVLEKKDDLDSKYNYETVTEEVRFKKKKQDMSVNVVLAILYIILIFIFAGGMHSRLSTGTTNYFGNSYLVIKTGSMETVDNSNTYIYDYNLNNQITQYSLIQMDEVKEEDMRLYDIYAFYGKDNEIIVHRLIAINEGANGLTYTFRGDANPASAPYERNISFDRVIARYNGNSNYIFGVITLYLSSNIGLITIFFAFSTALFFDLFEARSNKVATRRKLVILKEIFKDSETDLVTDEIVPHKSRNRKLIVCFDIINKKENYRQSRIFDIDYTNNQLKHVDIDESSRLSSVDAYLKEFNNKKLILHIDAIDKRTNLDKVDPIKLISYDNKASSIKLDSEVIQDILEKIVVSNKFGTNDVYTYKTYSKKLKKTLVIRVIVVDKRTKVETDDKKDVVVNLDSVSKLCLSQTYSHEFNSKLNINIEFVDKRTNKLPLNIRKYNVVKYDNKTSDGKYSYNTYIDGYDNNVVIQIEVVDKSVK